MARALGKPALPLNPRSPFEISLTAKLDQWFTQATTKINNDQVGAAIASAATINPDHPVHHVTGTTQINTIALPASEAGFWTLIPDGAWTLGTSGNIAIASTAVVGRLMTLLYDPATQKFYPSY